MKRILFVIPDLGAGGTNPSLEALYNHIKDLYEFHVYAISSQTRSRAFEFDEVLMPSNMLLSVLLTDFNKQRGIHKALAFIGKTLQNLLSFMKVDLKSVIGKKVAKKLESVIDPDCVVAYQEGFTTKFVSFFTISTKTAWVHCNYDMWMPKDKSEESLYVNYKHIVCVSDYTASVFTNRYPRLKERVIGIHNFVDYDRILAMGEQMIEDNRFITDRFSIISAGRFHSVKRFREIPRLAADIKKRGVDFYWYILGDASDPREIIAFNEALQEYNVSGYVKWLGGKNNPYPYFKASDLFVCTSESEACPMVFIESKIMGTPIVTTDFPSAYEFLHDDVDGRIVPLDRIADVIYELINDKAHYIRIKKNSINCSYNNEEQELKIQTVLE